MSMSEIINYIQLYKKRIMFFKNYEFVDFLVMECKQCANHCSHSDAMTG